MVKYESTLELRLKRHKQLEKPDHIVFSSPSGYFTAFQSSLHSDIDYIVCYCDIFTDPLIPLAYISIDGTIKGISDNSGNRFDRLTDIEKFEIYSLSEQIIEHYNH